MQPVPGEAYQHTNSSLQPAADATHSPPSHLVVLVNGLWGWQRDWKMTKRYFDDANNNGRLLVHISNANTGSLTYEGIDTCGARLAQEINSLTLSSPTLSHISLIGHSMGGLIARYALGLLTNPDTGLVAGVRPVCFVSVAAPHIGCSSDHTEQVEWHDRPWMRLLSHIVRSGHRESLPDTAAAAAAADSTVAAAQTSQQQQQQQREEDEGAGTHMSQKAQHNSSSSSSSGGSGSKAGGKVWPWKMKSVIQLLGCDSWQGPAPPAAAAVCKETAAFPSSSGSGGNASSDVKREGLEAQQHNISCCSCAAKPSSSTNGSSSGTSCAVCGSKDTQQQQQQQQNLPLAAEVPNAVYGNRCSSCGDSGCLLVTDSYGSSSSSNGSCGGPLLDYMCQDVQLQCSRCGTICNCYFLTGLQLFKFRWTYSSTGGDHLIPWSSSSLLFPHQLPKPRPAGPLPAAVWWGTPHIVEWSPDTSENQQQQQQQQSGRQQQQQQQQSEQGSEQRQQQQQQQHDLEEQFDPDRPDHDNADHNLQQQQQQHDAHRADLRSDSRSDLRSAESSGGVLTQRLRALQSVGPWRHYHVVWPKICLGSSHCNIQYNGSVNFVGRPVVQHLVDSVLLRAEEQANGC